MAIPNVLKIISAREHMTRTKKGECVMHKINDDQKIIIVTRRFSKYRPLSRK